MAKKQEEPIAEKITLREAIEKLEIAEDDTVFIHIIHGRDIADEPCIVKELDKGTLRRKVRCVHGNYGGQEYNYGCFRFLLD